MGRVHQENGGLTSLRSVLQTQDLLSATAFAPFNDTTTITSGSSLAASGAPPVVDGGLQFTGTNIVNMTVPSFSAQSTWTLDYWYKSTFTGQWTCPLTFRSTTGTYEIGMFVNFGDPGIYAVTGQGGWDHVRSGIKTNDGHWHHFMWSVNNGALTFYVDGVARITGRSMAALTIGGFLWGNWQNGSGGYPAAGEIQNVRFTAGVARTQVPIFYSKNSSGIWQLTSTPLSLGGMGSGGLVRTVLNGDKLTVIHTFLSNGTLLVPSAVKADYLVVGGGGGGGGRYMGGGGGAGGFLTGQLELSPGSFEITVGTGGAGGSSDYLRGSNGGNSSIESAVVAIGGGGGGSYSSATATGLNGGSGGGTSGYVSSGAGLGTSGQGNNGGNGAVYGAGGGGGAGGAGSNGTGSDGGNGGVGLASSISGYALFYAGGGGGGDYNGTGASLGGSGVGGNGAPGPADTSGGLPTAGINGRGGGGGGANGYGSASGATSGAAGGSGVVIVRYEI